MTVSFKHLIFLSLGLLIGCGGGNSSPSSSETSKNETCNLTSDGISSSICGTISAAANIIYDSDLNDKNTRSVNNSLISRAQSIPNLATIHGFANAIPTKEFSSSTRDRSLDRFYDSTDQKDIFQVQLQAGQRAQLQVVNEYEIVSEDELFTGDLDLYLFNSLETVVDSSQSLQEIETVTAPSNDVYYIVVSAYSGASRYVLQILPADDQSPANLASNAMADFEPDQLIVQYKNTELQTSNSSIQTLHTGINRPTLAFVNNENFRINTQNEDSFFTELSHRNPLSFRKMKTLLKMKQLKKQTNIESVSLNYIYHTQKIPNDPYYREQWHYPAMNLPQAWDITTGTPPEGSVIVAVIDTGVYSSHPELKNKLVSGYDFIRDDTRSGDDQPGIDSNPEDEGDGQELGSSSWHGTHVAGTIAAETNNGIGVAGVSWGAKIMPIRALGKNGGTSYDIMQSMLFAAGLENDSGTTPTQTADIINLSLGSYSSSPMEAALYKQIHDMGIIIVAAAGNENTSSPAYPASYDGVISVSATDYSNSKAPYSNFGEFIDIAAPGGNLQVNQNADDWPDGVLSTLVDDSTGTKKATFSFYQGTSMATPHVAGMLALMKAIHPDLDASTVDNLLAAGSLSDEAGTTGRDNIYGYGLANALKGVQAAQLLANGGTPPEAPPILTASPRSFNFIENGSATLTISNAGGGSPSLTEITSSSSWLTIYPLSVDSRGLGSYKIEINTDSLSDGLYQATILASFDSGSSLNIRTSLNVGSIDTSGKLATTYVLLYDIIQDQVIDSVDSISDGSNSLTFAFNKVPASTYYLISGTDVDNDGYICQLGEACAIYPASSQIAPIDTSTPDIINVFMTASILNSLTSVPDSMSSTEANQIGIKRPISIKTPTKEFKKVAR